MEFAENHLQKGSEFWKAVLFADESKYEYLDQMDKIVCGETPVKNLGKKKSLSDGQTWWWQLDGMWMRASINRRNLNFIEGSMNKHLCVNIRRERLKVSAEKFGIQEHFAFYHESDPKYSSHLIRGLCLYNCS